VSVTSHQRLDSVKFDEKIDQKNQQYKQKQYLIRDPMYRYRFIFGSFMVRSRSVRGPSTVRQRSVRGPSTVRSRSVYGTSGFFEIFSGAYSLRDLDVAGDSLCDLGLAGDSLCDLGSVRRSSRATLSHFGLISWRWRFVSAAPTHEIRRVTKECGLVTA
jgi:hypothetical protein